MSGAGQEMCSRGDMVRTDTEEHVEVNRREDLEQRVGSCGSEDLVFYLLSELL